MAVVAAKKKQPISGAGWSGRLAGVALCAFFAFGLATGLSQSGHIFALRLKGLLQFSPRNAYPTSVPALFSGAGASAPQAAPVATGARAGRGAIALVERSDGFYTLDAAGGLRGPVSPAGQGDLPVLSGTAAENARGAQLLDHAAALVRVEADLSKMVSEMKIGADGTATFFLDRPRLALTLDLDRAPIELARAARVLNVWRGHQEMIAALDLTTPGQAVVRLKPAALEFIDRPARARGRRTASAEVAASR